MRSGLIVVGALLLLLGIVWVGQGANLIGGSFMTGQTMWLVIGVVTGLFGAAVMWWAIIGYRRFP